VLDKTEMDYDLQNRMGLRPFVGSNITEIVFNAISKELKNVS
jgi:hypothetical protein